jgi:alpha-D-xyloside xylohydrolase
MSGPGIPLGDLTELWPPIFLRPGWAYDPFQEPTQLEARPGSLLCQVRSQEGRRASLEVQWIGGGILRLRAWTGQPPPVTSPMLASTPMPRSRPPALQRTEAGATASLGASAVEVSGPPFRLQVRAGRSRRWGTATGEASLVGPTALPLGIATAPDGREAFFLTWGLSHRERLYGLGEGFGRLDRRGSRAFLWCRDTEGTVSPAAYIVVPFLLSSHGYGLFLHQSSPSVWELGDPYPQSASLLVEDPYLDVFLLLADSPGQLLRLYTRLTGRTPPVPLWALGVWWSRCMYRDRRQVERVVSGLRDSGIPGDVIHLDPLWLEGREGRQRDGCHFRWSRERFGEPEELVAWLRERGFRLSLWENPYVWRDTQLHREGEERGYLARSRDGGLAASLENPEATPVDFTNPEAVAWWQEQHRPYLRAGVAAFKADYGEGLPADAVMADGSDGRRAHNLYPLLYNRAVYQVVREERGEGIIFARSGYAGSQRYPVHWLGDTPSTWEGMAAALRAGLSLSLSGFALWGHDIGGFWNPDGLKPPPPDLFVRWAQWGLLSPVARFHGIRGREPWYYGAEAVRIVRRFARLRYRLLPYLWWLVREAAATGLPLARPLFLEFPDDEASWQVDWQFMLGPWLLVAPVLEPEGAVRVYLPPGTWHDWWTAERVEGPCWRHLRVPLGRMPLYVRGDSLLPLAPSAPCLDRPSRSFPTVLQVRLQHEARARFWLGNRPFVVEAHRQRDSLHVRLAGLRRRIDLHFLEPAKVEPVRVQGAELLGMEHRGRGTILSLRTTGEMELEAVTPEA